ncbi:MAG TPA: response regulator [Candidatus Paceibacterota bacterium]|nr:response regulator [Candidatus Paceibacterota bacterium]
MTKVLVAEDDVLLSSIVVRNLVAELFEVHAAFDGLQAEQEIKNWQPDLVLLDLLMPKKDGFQVLADVRADPTTAKLRIIVFSNLGENETMANIEKFDLAGYFIKANTTPHEIVAKVKELFQK